MSRPDPVVSWSRYPWVAPVLRKKIESLVRRATGRSAVEASDRNPTSVYRPGTVVFYRGHQPLGNYLLLHGRIALESGHGNRVARGIEVEAPAILSAHSDCWPVTARAVAPSAVTYIPRPGSGAARHRTVAHSDTARG